MIVVGCCEVCGRDGYLTPEFLCRWCAAIDALTDEQVRAVVDRIETDRIEQREGWAS